ncbi:Hypothetical predicted protein [Octopus vulgaris]|uniref:Uncharacterized protein n=1 Tax=Octopus vulgaris TaxID=6645 RepID=A0AA36F845_OCTVU|nr:Hypothetical predicted protein [Octopus vulgaris]
MVTVENLCSTQIQGCQSGDDEHLSRSEQCTNIAAVGNSIENSLPEEMLEMLVLMLLTKEDCHTAIAL